MIAYYRFIKRRHWRRYLNMIGKHGQRLVKWTPVLSTGNTLQHFPKGRMFRLLGNKFGQFKIGSERSHYGNEQCKVILLSDIGIT